MFVELRCFGNWITLRASDLITIRETDIRVNLSNSAERDDCDGEIVDFVLPLD